MQSWCMLRCEQSWSIMIATWHWGVGVGWDRSTHTHTPAHTHKHTDSAKIKKQFWSPEPTLFVLCESFAEQKCCPTGTGEFRNKTSTHDIFCPLCFVFFFFFIFNTNTAFHHFCVSLKEKSQLSFLRPAAFFAKKKKKTFWYTAEMQCSICSAGKTLKTASLKQPFRHFIELCIVLWRKKQILGVSSNCERWNGEGVESGGNDCKLERFASYVHSVVTYSCPIYLHLQPFFRQRDIQYKLEIQLSRKNKWCLNERCQVCLHLREIFLAAEKPTLQMWTGLDAPVPHCKGPFTPNVSVSITLVQRNVANVVHG